MTRRLLIVSVFFAVALPAWIPAADAQTATIAAVKAGFLFNFANYAGWPAATLAPGQKLSLCVVGDDRVADALSRVIRGRTVGGHELAVQVVNASASTRGCHLLYASGLDLKQFAQVMEAIRGTPVLTVSDADRFAESGGIAQLIVENDRMRFAINSAAAERAHIHLSSKLLSLARIVKDE